MKSLTFANPTEFANAILEASIAHHRYETRLGHKDENWPEWYAQHVFNYHSAEHQPSQPSRVLEIGQVKSPEDTVASPDEYWNVHERENI